MHKPRGMLAAGKAAGKAAVVAVKEQSKSNLAPSCLAGAAEIFIRCIIEKS